MRCVNCTIVVTLSPIARSDAKRTAMIASSEMVFVRDATVCISFWFSSISQKQLSVSRCVNGITVVE